MSVVLGLPQETLIKAFDEIQPGWQNKGLTAQSILTYAQEKNITTTVLYADNVVGRHKPLDRKHRKAMTFAIEGNHALFYKNPRVMLNRAPAKRKLRTEKAPQPVQWVPYEGLQDGTFYYTDLDTLRLEFLNLGTCPQVTASAPHCLKSLKVGKCIIKKDPVHSEQLRAWLRNMGLEWLGDGLPSASLRVLLSLLQPKRKHLSLIHI